MKPDASAHDALDAVYRTHGAARLATLIRLLGDFDAAEEALHDAFVAAADTGRATGVPANPSRLARLRGTLQGDRPMRRRARFDASLRELALDQQPDANVDGADDEIEDDELRLIFTCCHPALAAGRADRADVARGRAG